MLWFLGGVGAGSGIQLRRRSRGGRFTSPPRKTTRRPWHVKQYWSDEEERLKNPSDGSKNHIAALMEWRRRDCPGRATWPRSAKRDAGSSVLGRASISCPMVLRYWLCPLRRSTNRRLAKERGFALDPKESLYPMVRG